MAILITDTIETILPDARVEGERLWLSSSELEAATGWASRPEGFCREGVCVPIPPGREREFLRGDQIDAAMPLEHSEDGGTWVFGTSAAERAAALSSLEAPDFSLPDPSGRRHSLSEHRGKKVLLVSWASW